jgi:hypothetical protein
MNYGHGMSRRNEEHERKLKRSSFKKTGMERLGY